MTLVPGFPLLLAFSQYELGGKLSSPCPVSPFPYSMCGQEVVAGGWEGQSWKPVHDGEVSERRMFGCRQHSQGWKQGQWDMVHHARWAQEDMQCLVPEEGFGCCRAIWRSNMQSRTKPWGLCGLSHSPSAAWRGKRRLEEWAEVRRALFMAPPLLCGALKETLQVFWSL